MRISSSTDISAPADRVWAIVSDPARMLQFMAGVTRWEVLSKRPSGLGSRYRVLMRVGAAEVGGLIEVVEWDEPWELAWSSVLGLDQRGRWRLRETAPGHSRVELRMTYGVAGAGLSGWLAEHAAAPTVSTHLHRSLSALKRLVEYEQLRERARLVKG